MADAKTAKAVEEADVKLESQPIIPGTSYKTPEDAAKGFSEMQALIDRQGNELGTARQQLTDAQAQAKLAQVKSAPVKPPDYDAELAKIDKNLDGLDVDDPGYTKERGQLERQARTVLAQKIEASTSEKMSAKFAKQLNDRDARQGEKQWQDKNPDFNNPEMQAAIHEKMQTDRTGIMDEFLAYREIQNAQLKAKLQEVSTANDDFQNRLKLKAGESEAGKVVTKAGSSAGTDKPKEKTTGAALREGMKEAFRAAG